MNRKLKDRFRRTQGNRVSKDRDQDDENASRLNLHVLSRVLTQEDESTGGEELPNIDYTQVIRESIQEIESIMSVPGLSG